MAMALLKLAALRKKALLFAAAASFAARLRLLLGAFGLRAAVLHASLPRNSRHRIIQASPCARLAGTAAGWQCRRECPSRGRLEQPCNSRCLLVGASVCILQCELARGLHAVGGHV